jgi:uncharacterized protein
MAELTPTPRTRLRRLPSRGSYDTAVVHAILDEALVCHLGFVHEGQPFVLPTTYARIGDVLYVHGSAASRMLRALREGIGVCVTVTLLDGLVLARSAFHHSMNYRSVVILGTAIEITDEDEKRRALNAIVDHVVPGRSAEVRGPSAKELQATSVLSVPIDEASAKVRDEPPQEKEEEDYSLDSWAGLIPLTLQPQAPIGDPRLRPGIPVPHYAATYLRPR